MSSASIDDCAQLVRVRVTAGAETRTLSAADATQTGQGSCELPFEVTGVAAALVSPLAAARISVFPIATFDTDYLLLKEETFERAVDVLRAAGHEIA